MLYTGFNAKNAIVEHSAVANQKGSLLFSPKFLRFLFSPPLASGILIPISFLNEIGIDNQDVKYLAVVWAVNYSSVVKYRLVPAAFCRKAEFDIII